MSQLFRFADSVKCSPAIDTWMGWQKGELGKIAKHWFEIMRKCGDDVREVLHDGHPTACVADAAFAYVNAFNAHVNVGFFRGAEILLGRWDKRQFMARDLALWLGASERRYPQRSL